jgi:hypothetical protein
MIVMTKIQDAETHLQDMFQRAANDDPDVRHRRDLTDECGCYPNQIWRVDDNAVLVVFQSERGSDWALSKRGLERVHLSKESGRVARAYIVHAKRFADRKEAPIFVAQQTVEHVLSAVNGFKPRQSAYYDDRPYWFLDEHFRVVGDPHYGDDYPM